MIILPQYLIVTPHKLPQRNWGARIVGSHVVAIAPNADLGVLRDFINFVSQPAGQPLNPPPLTPPPTRTAPPPPPAAH